MGLEPNLVFDRVHDPAVQKAWFGILISWKTADRIIVGIFFGGKVVVLRRVSQMKYDQINLTVVSLPSDCFVFEGGVFVHGPPNHSDRKQGFNKAFLRDNGG